MALFLSDQLNPAFMISIIHPFLQLFAHFEKRQLFPCNLNRLAGFGIPPVYPPYFLTKKEQRPRISTRSPCASASAI
jgi:hypothetical protein